MSDAFFSFLKKTFCDWSGTQKVREVRFFFYFEEHAVKLFIVQSYVPLFRVKEHIIIINPLFSFPAQLYFYSWTSLEEHESPFLCSLY